MRLEIKLIRIIIRKCVHAVLANVCTYNNNGIHIWTVYALFLFTVFHFIGSKNYIFYFFYFYSVRIEIISIPLSWFNKSNISNSTLIWPFLHLSKSFPKLIKFHVSLLCQLSKSSWTMNKPIVLWCWCVEWSSPAALPT